MERISSQNVTALASMFFARVWHGLTSLPVGEDASVIALEGILKNILSKALENNILT